MRLSLSYWALLSVALVFGEDLVLVLVDCWDLFRIIDGGRLVVPSFSLLVLPPDQQSLSDKTGSSQG